MTVSRPALRFVPPSSRGDDGKLSPERVADRPDRPPKTNHVALLSLEDADIVARVRAGDHEAFHRLYESSLDLLLRFAYGYSHSQQVAQEVVGDIFLSLWERRTDWKPSFGIRAYLLAAVRNRMLGCHHERAGARAEEKVPAAEISRATRAAPPFLPDVHLELEERRAQLRRAIAMLSPDRRRVLMLRWQGLPSREIAAAMGIPRMAVDQTVSRAVKKLRAVVHASHTTAGVT